MTGAPVAVLGAGSWGTALAVHLARLAHPVLLWARDRERGMAMEAAAENAVYLEGFKFPAGLHVELDANRALAAGPLAVLAVPSGAFRALLAGLRPPEDPERLWVIATKGLEEATDRRMSEVLASMLPDARAVVLAGPSLAREVAAGGPTSVLAAAETREDAERVQRLFHGPTFRVYTTEDVRGVEIGTSLKNVVALAAGIVDGMGLGANAKGALVTRGLAEITRLGVALGARRETFLGLAGVGDLVTTCSSPLSRNRGLGEAIGRGTDVREAVAAMTQVAEGVPTTRSAVRLAARAGIEMPIAEQVRRVLDREVAPADAVRALMTRPPKGEGEDP